MKQKSILLILCTFLFLFECCTPFYFRSDYKDANELIHSTENLTNKPFLKAHLKDGGIFIFKDTWRVDTLTNSLSGNGTKFNFNRDSIYHGTINIPIDSVAIFEANTKIVETEKMRVTALAILTAVDVIVGIICLTNPKACFGSCPTFYVHNKGNIHYADAEGFSDAIFPSLEYSDIDAIDNVSSLRGDYSVTMKNEALETHCVNDIRLLAFPKTDDQRVFISPANDFYLCENNYPPDYAVADEGIVTEKLRFEDKQELFSLADKDNMNCKEEIYLDFSDIKDSGNLGLVISFRQTLMTTYLVYTALGYMGDAAGEIIAGVETNGKTKPGLGSRIRKELGNIDVYSWDVENKKWIFQGGWYETGPIAFNKQIIRLKNQGSGSSVKLKLVLNKGLWRIDYLALTNIRKMVIPIEIPPSGVLNKGIPDGNALNALLNPGKHLVSMPGSEYRIDFNLPETESGYELFLLSRGYYLEWMRSNWLANKNLLRLKQMIENPAQYLRSEAKNYKTYEATMEREFWSSKIDTKSFVYYEN